MDDELEIMLNNEDPDQVGWIDYLDELAENEQ